MTRAAAMMIITGLMVMFTAPAALGNPFAPDCTADVPIGTPTNGPANNIDPGPEDPRTGDPFKKDAKASLYEVYGYGGMSWVSLNPGCEAGPDALNDPGAAAAGTAANIMLGALALGVGIVAAILRFAYDPDTLNVFNPIMRLAAEALGENVFQAMFWVTLALTGLLIIARTMRARFAESAGNTGWVVFAGLIGMVAATWPLTVAPIVDNVLTSSIGTVHTQMAKATGNTDMTPADGAAANLHHSLLYETWCSGMVGRSAGKTADEYCPRLFAASTFTREEAKRVAGDEEAAQELKEDKEEKFKEIAEELKEADPTAYEYLAGEHNTSRMMYAALGWFGFLCASPFLLVAGFLLLFALIVVRVAIMLLPLLVVVGGFPPLRRYVTGTLDYAAGAVLTALLFGVASAVFIAVIGGFMSPDSQTHPLLSMLLLGITTYAAWKVTKPLRKVRNLADVRSRLASARKGSSDHGHDSGAAAEDRRDANGTPYGPQRPSSGSGGLFAPTVAAATFAASSTPAEAQPSMFKAASSGAMRGAAATAALGAMSGGTVTAGAMAAGAARGAGAAVLAGRMARTPDAAEAAESAPRAHAHAAQVSASGTRAPIGALPSAPKSGSTPGGTDEPRARVYRPGESTPAEGMRLVEPQSDKGERVYPIYTPEVKGAGK